MCHLGTSPRLLWELNTWNPGDLEELISISHPPGRICSQDCDWLLRASDVAVFVFGDAHVLAHLCISIVALFV